MQRNYGLLWPVWMPDGIGNLLCMAAVHGDDGIDVLCDSDDVVGAVSFDGMACGW